MSEKAALRAVDEGVPPQAWQKVSWVTPLLNSWQVFLAVIVVALLQNVELIIDMATGEQKNLGLLLLFTFLGVLGFMVIFGVFSYFSWRATSYAVTDQAVWLRTGIFFKNQKHVRLERIQAVDVWHPLLGRIFGLGKLTVESAGSGGSLQIGFLKSSELSDLRAQIMARAAGVFEDPQVPELAVDGSAQAPLEAPEQVVYSVTTGRLIGSILLSGRFVASLLGALAILALAFLALSATDMGPGNIVFFSLVLAVPLALTAVGQGWARFSSEFDFRAAISPDGVRIRRGLLERRAETIPPGRVHAVQITQPLLWRLAGWYRVRLSQATSRSPEGGNQKGTDLLLPVGNKRDALLALWLVIPNLGVADTDTFFEQLFHKSGPAPGFIQPPKRAWIFHPLTQRRRALVLTETSMVVRDGQFKRIASFVTYQRIQSLVVQRGPVAHVMGLAGLKAALVRGIVSVSLTNLPQQRVATACQTLVTKTDQARSAEPPERWFSRVKAEVASQDVATQPEPSDSNSSLPDTRFAPQ